MISPHASHSQGHGTIPLSSIFWDENVRQDTTDLRSRIADELAPSIYEHGLIQPLVVHFHPDGRCEGIAGWCRAQALLLLNEDTAPYVIRENLAPDEIAALKLEENIRRTDMPWSEICVSIARIHKLKTDSAARDHKTWGMAQTGHLLGCNKSQVSGAVFLAKLIALRDEEILDCPNMAAAQRVCLQRRNDAGTQILHTRHAVQIKAVQKVTKQSGPADPRPEAQQSRSSVEPLPAQPNKPPLEVDLSKMLINADCLEWFKTATPAYFDLVYTDHPYGIDMEELEDMVEIDRMKDSHQVEENLLQMPELFEGVYRVLKSDSYFLLWCDLKHWNLFVGYHTPIKSLPAWLREIVKAALLPIDDVLYIPGLAERAGFTCQMWPLIAQKTNGAKNRAAGQWWTKNYECVAVFRKGKANLKEAQPSAIKPCNFALERKAQRNPFAKPFEFTKWLLEPILVPGMRVLDCYAGGGSMVRGLLNMGAEVTAIEKFPKDFAALQNHIKTYFLDKTRNHVHFV